MSKPDLYNLTLPELEQLMSAWGQPSYRARQLYRQLYVQFADDPAAMTDLPVALRERLRAEVSLGHLTLERVQEADDGATRKALFRLPDGAVLETVLMIYADRATVCVSTQAGCGMGCVFCATGRLGLLRNLSPGEIVQQAAWASRELRRLAPGGQRPRSDLSSEPDERWWLPEEGHQGLTGSAPESRGRAWFGRVTNLVFMGMGEPFANYERWWAAVERLHDPQGFNLGARSMTVSTVGLVPGIRRLAGERLPVNLAISLHAPDDELRGALMPVNRRYPIAELLDATREYIQRTGRRVSFEYVLLQGRNDHPHQAQALARLLRGQGVSKGPPLLCHVNLIPWNPVPGTPLGRSERQRVLAFQQVLLDYGVACTVRVERGVAIAAACGQLAGTQHLTAVPAP
ncbi:MAG: 23S rRNA (adenine(2503)-C(2))-methyltransferase RlmN [Chloroflexi bacterium OHK40]